MLIKSEIEVDVSDVRQAISNYLSAKLGSNITVNVKEIVANGNSITVPVTVKAMLEKVSTSYMDR
jgi:hypothetical protein